MMTPRRSDLTDEFSGDSTAGPDHSSAEIN
jgi:hypothetical protein